METIWIILIVVATIIWNIYLINVIGNVNEAAKLYIAMQAKNEIVKPNEEKEREQKMIDKFEAEQAEINRKKQLEASDRFNRNSMIAIGIMIIIIVILKIWSMF